MSSNFRNQLTPEQFWELFQQFKGEKIAANPNTCLPAILFENWLREFEQWYKKKYSRRGPIEASSPNCAFHRWQEISPNTWKCNKDHCGKVYQE